MMFVVKCFFTVLALSLGNFETVFAELAEDDDVCHLKSREGICSVLSGCQSVSMRYSDNPANTFDTVVCCPDREDENGNEYQPSTTTTTTRTTVVPDKTWPAGKRPAEIMCSRYARQMQSSKNRLVNDTLCAFNFNQPIRNGAERAAPKEFPYMAAIGYNASIDSYRLINWWCKGALISKNFVLTSARCLSTPEDEGKLEWVQLGKLNLDDSMVGEGSQVRRVAEIINYPNYREDIKYNDIGLVKLDSPVTFDDYVRPACLSVVSRFPNDHNAVEVTWGYDQKEETHDVMWKSTISMISHARCNGDESITKLLPTGVDDSSQLCGHYVAGDKFCTLGVGSTLIVENTKEECMYDIIGIKNFHDYDCKIVYTRVYNYMSWIESIVWPEFDLD